MTLYIRDGEFCRNFIDLCCLYQYKVSQQTRQTITRALPACNRCDGCKDCLSRDKKIKGINYAILERECINLVWRRRCERKSKKLSEGKSIEEICKIMYRLENSSTKPTKDSPRRRRRPAMVQATGSTLSTTADRAEEEEEDTAEAEEEETPACPAQPGAPNPPID